MNAGIATLSGRLAELMIMSQEVTTPSSASHPVPDRARKGNGTAYEISRGENGG